MIPIQLSPLFFLLYDFLSLIVISSILYNSLCYLVYAISSALFFFLYDVMKVVWVWVMVTWYIIIINSTSE